LNALTFDELVQRITPDVTTATAGQRLAILNGILNSEAIVGAVYDGIRAVMHTENLRRERPPRLRRFGGFATFSFWRSHPSSVGLLPNGPVMTEVALRLRNDRSNSTKQTKIISLRCEPGKTGEVEQSVEGGEGGG